MKVKDISAKKSKQTMILIILVGILFIVEIFMALQAMKLKEQNLSTRQALYSMNTKYGINFLLDETTDVKYNLLNQSYTAKCYTESDNTVKYTINFNKQGTILKDDFDGEPIIVYDSDSEFIDMDLRLFDAYMDEKIEEDRIPDESVSINLKDE